MRSRVRTVPGPGKPGSVARGTVLGVGRLGRQKGFDLLVRAFAEATRRHHGWDLVIAGDGPERAALAALAASRAGSPIACA